jgi:hypothetical protein
MARKKITYKQVIRNTPNATPRHLWLAGLGMAVIARREGMTMMSDATRRIVGARAQARATLQQAQSSLIAAGGDLRNRLETGAAQLGHTLEVTLSPLVAKLKPAKAKRTVRRGRKPGSKNVRRAVKKATAKRARKA